MAVAEAEYKARTLRREVVDLVLSSPITTETMRFLLSLAELVAQQTLLSVVLPA